MIQVLLFGDHWNRQPLAYAPIRDRLAGRIALTELPEEADIALFSHVSDLTRHGAALAAMVARRPSLRPVLLSQDPVWDTAEGADPFVKYRSWKAGDLSFGYAVLNHFTSTIFDTEALPYPLLCDPRFVAQYRPMFARNAGLSAQDWRLHWRVAAWDAVFPADPTVPPAREAAFEDAEVWGLAALAAKIARHCKGPNILRPPRGSDDDLTRSTPGDWHAETLAELDMKCRWFCALETVHQRNHVSERILDGYAIGAVPLYIGTKGHAVGELLGRDSWQNLAPRLPRKDAPKTQPFDARTQPGEKITKAYQQTQERLALRLQDQTAIDSDLDRLAERLYTALRQQSL